MVVVVVVVVFRGVSGGIVWVGGTGGHYNEAGAINGIPIDVCTDNNDHDSSHGSSSNSIYGIARWTGRRRFERLTVCQVRGISTPILWMICVDNVSKARISWLV